MNDAASANIDTAGDAAVTEPSMAAAQPGPSFDPGRLAGVTAILVRELRGRMRGKRAFIFLTVYLGTLATLLSLALRTTESMPMLSAPESIAIGRGIFAGVLLVETLVVVALAPAYTAGSISQERERQTYDLLAVTPISSLSIVIGKLLSSLSYLVVVVGASLPIACLAFAFGGIGPDDLFRGYLVLAATGIGIGAIGVLCSAAMNRTQAATVAAFIATALMVVGASAAWIGLDSRLENQTSERPSEALLYLNPFVAQFDVICQATGEACIAQQAVMARNTEMFGQPRFDETTGQPVGVGVEGQFVAQPIPAGGGFWPKSVLAYLALGAVAIVASAQSISPTRRWRWTGRSLPFSARRGSTR
jgi:ABC-type transport system involved in multi-copper enzyme maturation permease subunit